MVRHYEWNSEVFERENKTTYALALGDTFTETHPRALYKYINGADQSSFMTLAGHNRVSMDNGGIYAGQFGIRAHGEYNDISVKQLTADGTGVSLEGAHSFLRAEGISAKQRVSINLEGYNNTVLNYGLVNIYAPFEATPIAVRVAGENNNIHNYDSYTGGIYSSGYINGKKSAVYFETGKHVLTNDSLMLAQENDTTGVIEIASAAGNIRIYNNGSIKGMVNGYAVHQAAYARPVEIDQSGISIENTGAIEGHIQLGSWGDEILNHGHIYGRVDLNGGDDRYWQNNSLNKINYTIEVSGGQGNDRIAGGREKNSFSGDGGNDTLEGFGGDDILRGGADHDYISGGEGADTLSGGLGRNELSGGPGNDLYVFDFNPYSIKAEPSIILDFLSSEDDIALDQTVFKGLTFDRNGLWYGCLEIGSKPKDASDHVIYDPSNGRLYYDEDGIGPIGQLHIATINIAVGSNRHPAILYPEDFQPWV
ncbi:M10 family metallopeptidase C-terminal domain-containing protein [Microvirga pudoricolor]|uniref:M10 family metallopeptidase C-terminal domain-containing protein n=1 Tax=Microvirga pudoricolor TaxID=2778729 RepID=UPI00194DE34B|nr:hypothetical protein [Microvirga pudoricolor]MBM6595681.1 hypothetical protein [Microvirga pudoricolor]